MGDQHLLFHLQTQRDQSIGNFAQIAVQLPQGCSCVAVRNQELFYDV